MVIPGRIETTMQSEHEMWLRATDGRELPIRMSDIGLAARTGHTVTVLWGSMVGNEEGQYFAGRNHTTEEVRSDVLALGHELRSWHLNVGAGASFFRWLLVPAVVLGLFGFILVGGGLENRLALALGGLVAGALLGFASWAVIGSNLGPERRARAIADEINSFAEQRLLAA
jgi:hypothetical protein